MGRNTSLINDITGRLSIRTSNSRTARIESERAELFKYCPVGLTGSFMMNSIVQFVSRGCVYNPRKSSQSVPGTRTSLFMLMYTIFLNKIFIIIIIIIIIRTLYLVASFLLRDRTNLLHIIFILWCCPLYLLKYNENFIHEIMWYTYRFNFFVIFQTRTLWILVTSHAIWTITIQTFIKHCSTFHSRINN